MFFDWKIQLEKIQLTRDLKDNTIIFQESDYHVEMIKAIVIPQQGHKSLVSRRYLYNISSSKNTCSNDKIS